MRKITQYELAELINKAYLKVATMGKGISGFSAEGILPLNPDKFTEADFLPASTDLDVQIAVTENANEHDLTESVAGISLWLL